MIAPGVQKIVTNADDLGESATVNEAIFAGMAEGLVTSATILATGAAVAEACGMAAEFPHCSFGVHLNLMDHVPLSDPQALGDLVSERGAFNRGVRSSRDLRRLRRAIEAELAAQVERVTAAGVAVSHFDSHYHIHTVPALLPVVKSLIRRFGVRRVRASMNHYLPAACPSASLVWKKRAWNLALRCLPPSAITTDCFTGLDAFVDHGQRIAGNWRSVEIMLHPGSPEGPAELQKLRAAIAADPSIKARLVNYKAIGAVAP